MKEVKLYPELSAKIIDVMRLDDENTMLLYAAALIEAQNDELRRIYESIDVGNQKWDLLLPLKNKEVEPRHAT